MQLSKSGHWNQVCRMLFRRKIDVSLHQLSWQLICHFVWYKLAFFSDYKNLFVLSEPSFFEFGLISESYCIETSKTKEWPEKSYGENFSVFHADNAAGQNKHKTMLHYLPWHCFKWLNTEISLHFMNAGHIKWICDECFWLIRLRYMRSDSQCLQLLATVVNRSASWVMKPFVHHLRAMNGILF